MNDLKRLIPINKIKQIEINPQSLPVDPDMRIIWKITQILLVLYYSSSQTKASLKKIHFFLSYLESSQKANILKDIDVNNKLKRLKLRIAFNPYNSKVIKYGVCSGLIKIKGQSIVLTDLAKFFLEKIEKNNDLMKFEKGILKSIGKSKYLEKTIESIMKGE